METENPPQAPETKTHPLLNLLSVSRARLLNLECRDSTKTQFRRLAICDRFGYKAWKNRGTWDEVMRTVNCALDGIKRNLPQTTAVFEQMLVEEVIVPSKPSSQARHLNPKAVSQAILASEQLVACKNEKGRHDLAWYLLQARHQYLQRQMREINSKPQLDANGLYLQQLASQQTLVFSALKELDPLHQPRKNRP